MESRDGEFQLVTDRCAEALRREIDFDPSSWTAMSQRDGATQAAKQLLATEGTASAELSKLALRGRLDQSVEWFALVYDELFTPEERQAAYRRLRSFEAPVDEWLQDRLGRSHLNLRGARRGRCHRLPTGLSEPPCRGRHLGPRA